MEATFTVKVRPIMAARNPMPEVTGWAVELLRDSEYVKTYTEAKVGVAVAKAAIDITQAMIAEAEEC